MDFLVFREPVNAWTHASWLLLALPATYWLWRRSRGDRLKQLSMLIFGLSMVLCYGGSTLYHGVRSSHGQIQVFATLDYIGIYLLIGGTYTAAVVTLLQGLWRLGILSLVWLMAVTGITLRLVAVPIPSFVSTGLYLLMGWCSVLCYFELARTLSHRAMIPIVLGGVLYSLGAVWNMVDLPVLFLSAHEFMHVCVMGGTLAHYCFILRSVTPFERSRVSSFPEPLATAELEPFQPSLAPAQGGS